MPKWIRCEQFYRRVVRRSQERTQRRVSADGPQQKLIDSGIGRAEDQPKLRMRF